MVILIAGGIVGWLQARQQVALARQEVALAESRQQLDEARASVTAERASNAELENSLNKLENSLNRREIELNRLESNILAEISGAKLLRGEFDAALRLAARATPIDLALPSSASKGSAAALATALSPFVRARSAPVIEFVFTP